MLSTCILGILVLIHIICTVNGDIKRSHLGSNVELSCGVTGSDIEDKTTINALWKKETGQRVIWRYSGLKKIADTFQNRTFDINENLTLIINKCDKSDQGMYILCINGKPYCEVRLLIIERCKRSTEKLCSENLFSDKKQDLTDPDEKITNPSNPQRTRFTILGVILLVVLLCLVILLTKRKDTTKNDKSEVHHPLHTVIQSN